MSESTLLRRGDTGAPGNKGKFDGHHRSDADDSIADQLAAAAHEEYLADLRVNAIVSLNLDPSTDVTDMSTTDGVTTINMVEDQRGGWDQVTIDKDGTLSFYRGGVKHRVDGPAVYREGQDPTDAYDRAEVWVDGRFYPNPDDAVGLNLTGVDGAPGSRVLHFRAGDNYTATIEENGPTTFIYDGDLHRLGGPAVIHQDGREQWFGRGTELPAPLPAEPRVEVVMEGPRGLSRVYGAKHTPGTPLPEISESIRNDMANARRLGMLPRDAKFKVSTKSREKHIQILVEGLRPADVLNPRRDEAGEPWYTPLGRQVSDRVQAIGQAYNRWEEGAEASQSQVDFYLGSSISTRP